MESFELTGQPINEKTVHEFLLLSPENPSSVSSCLWNVRENIRSARNRLSEVLWLIVNEFYLSLQSLTTGELLRLDRELFFQKVRTFCLAFSGACDHTLLHDEAWNFLRLGRALERSIQTTQSLDFHGKTLMEDTDSEGHAVHIHHWQVLLRSVDGLEAYIQNYQNRIVPKNAVELLINRINFPRSILFNVRLLRELISTLPHQSDISSFWLLEQNISGLEVEIRSHAAADVLQNNFDDYLQDILRCLLRLNGLICRTYFGVSEAVGDEKEEEPQKTQGGGPQ